MVGRRGFILGSAASAMAPFAIKGAEGTPARDPFKGTGGVPLKVGHPCLQAPGSTTMGVSWAVSGLAKGVVEVADNPEFRNSRIVKSGGFGLVPIDTQSLQVRLEGLSPSTKYYYRTITTPFTDYANIYNAKLGEPIVGETHAFTTLGAGNHGGFAMIYDTHAQWKSLELRA